MVSFRHSKYCQWGAVSEGLSALSLHTAETAPSSTSYYQHSMWNLHLCLCGNINLYIYWIRCAESNITKYQNPSWFPQWWNNHSITWRKMLSFFVLKTEQIISFQVMRKILKNIFQTLDKWDQKLSSNSVSNSIIPFFSLLKIENLIGEKKSVKKTKNISPALLAYSWVISVGLCHLVIAKLDFLCRHVPKVYSIHPLWFSLSWSFAEVFLFCMFCCGYSF